MRVTNFIFTFLVVVFFLYCTVTLYLFSSMKNAKATMEGSQQTTRFRIGQDGTQPIVIPTERNAPSLTSQAIDRISIINHRFDPIKPLDGKTFRDHNDRPPKEGLLERPGPGNEDSALAAMWARLDRQTGLINNELQAVKIPPAERWKKSLADTEARAKSLATPNATRDQMAFHAQEVLQSDIWKSQHPPSCESAKYLYVANDKNQYGFGAQLHHFVYALIMGYASNRVVVIEKGRFKYSERMSAWCNGDKSIECFFEPLGPCTKEISDDEGLVAPLWIPGDEDRDDRVLRIRFRSSVEYRAWMPKLLKPILEQFHERPHLWWIGQFTSYMMRPSEKLKAGYYDFKSGLKNLAHPFMGMHVRGKEKKSEAPVHALAEYMPYVKYNPIYLATDDIDPYNDSKKFNNYTWVHGVDKSSGRLSGVGDRHAENAILNLLYDVYVLSESDYFIGTDSSQISRAVYELMQTMNVDATRLGVSLDTINVDHELWFYWFII